MKYIKSAIADIILEALRPVCAQCGKMLDQELDYPHFEDEELIINQAVYSCPNCYKEK
jgi:DNA-directed RNA polymerase subunit RPC12/RpoP